MAATPTLASLAKRIDALERNVRDLAEQNAERKATLDQLSTEAIRNAAAVSDLQKTVEHHALKIAG
jgi:predicted  nucleic acid-binding Zn-ribbon protein